MGRLSRVTSPLTIFTIATVVGVLTGLQVYNYVALTSEHKQPFIVLLGLNMTYWWSWALLVPGVLWMARRYRFERHTWKKAALVHALAVTVFTAAHVALSVLARGVIMTQFTERPFDGWMYFREGFFLNFDWEMMTYGRSWPSSTRSTITASRRSARSRARNCRHSWPRRSSRRCSASCIRTSCSTR